MKNFSYLVILVSSLSFAQKNKLVFAYENPAKLLQFLDKSQVNYDTKDLAVLYQAADWLDLYYKERLTVPSVYLFNAEGNRIINNNEADMCGGIINGIESLEKIKTYKTDTNDTMNKWLEKIDFRFTSEENVQKFLKEPYDLYVIIFYGNLIKTKSSNPTAFNWYNSLKKNTSIKIKPILLSIDIMDDWRLSPEFKTEFGLK
jgi:hypothetical protein